MTNISSAHNANKAGWHCNDSRAVGNHSGYVTQGLFRMRSAMYGGMCAATKVISVASQTLYQSTYSTMVYQGSVRAVGQISGLTSQALSFAAVGTGYIASVLVYSEYANATTDSTYYVRLPLDFVSLVNIQVKTQCDEINISKFRFDSGDAVWFILGTLVLLYGSYHANNLRHLANSYANELSEKKIEVIK